MAKLLVHRIWQCIPQELAKYWVMTCWDFFYLLLWCWAKARHTCRHSFCNMFVNTMAMWSRMPKEGHHTNVPPKRWSHCFYKWLLQEREDMWTCGRLHKVLHCSEVREWHMDSRWTPQSSNISWDFNFTFAEMWRISFSHIEKMMIMNHGNMKTCCESGSSKCCRFVSLLVLHHAILQSCCLTH